MAKHKKDKRQEQNVSIPPKKKPFSFPLWEKHPYWIATFVLTLLTLYVFRFHAPLAPDTVASYSFKPFVDDALKRHIYPLWNPYIFSGMPFFASMSALFIDPINDILLILTKGLDLVFHFSNLTEVQRAAMLLLNLVLIGYFTFLFLRRRNLSKEAALIGCLAMALMPQILGYSNAGHATQIATLALMPLVLLLVDALLEKQNLLFFSLTGLAVGVQLLRSHVQICYYTYLTVGLFFAVWAVAMIREKKIRRVLSGVGLLVGVILAGFLVSALLNLSVLEYSKYSIRGGAGGGVSYDYATSWSFSPSEIATFFIPSFMGFGKETYWGAMPFTDFPHYFGMVVFVLAAIGLAVRRDRYTVFFGILAGFSLIVSFGKHFPLLYWPMYKFLPFFNKFRAPDMIHLLFKFSAVSLAAMGVQSLMEFKDDPKSLVIRNVKRTLAAFGIVLGLLFIVLLFGKQTYLGWAKKAGDLAEAAYDMALTDGLKAVCLFGLTSFLILRAAAKKIRPGVFALALSVLLVLDLWFVDRKFIESSERPDVESYFKATPEVEYLKNQKGPFRVFTVQDQRPPNWYAYHFIPNTFGYHAAKLRIYQETLDAFGLPEGYLFKYLTQVNGQYAWKNPKDVSSQQIAAHRAFFRLTNVKYVLSPIPLPDSSLKMVAPPPGQGGCAVYEFTGALPRAFFPKGAVTAAGKDAVLGYMSSGRFDPSETAVLEEKLPGVIVPSDGNRVEIEKIDLHEIRAKADVKTPSLLVFSEVYYPAGWKAYVDGKETKIYKTDYLLRSVLLEPGSHEIRMEFKPKMFRLGLLVTLATSFLLILGAVAGGVRSRKKSAKTEEPQP
jgi:hypothetical protein